MLFPKLHLYLVYSYLSKIAVSFSQSMFQIFFGLQ
jgi:hypothetical protein